MKCPHCFCNYDDAERECPMCGRRAWPGARGRRSRASQAGARPVVPRGRQTPRPPARREEEVPRRRRRRAVRWLVLALFILLQFLPMLEGFAQSAFSRITRGMEFRDDGFLFSDPDRYMPEPSADAPADAQERDGIIPSGEYYCEDTGLFLSIDNSDQTYWLSFSDYEENGDFYAMYNEPGSTDETHYTEEFPDTDYSSYVFYLYHEMAETYDYEITLVVAYIPLEGDGGIFYLNNTYANAPWLPLDRAVRLER